MVCACRSGPWIVAALHPGRQERDAGRCGATDNFKLTHNHKVLAIYCHKLHNAFMPVQITIRGVAEEVRDELALRAAARRQSMQEFLRGELERIASRPSVDLWLRDVRRRKAATGATVPRSAILQARDADRR